MTQEYSTGTVLFNRYQILHKLGGGSQGIIYLAEDQRLRQNVVVKQLSLRGADWKAVELFEREANVLQSLRHPAIPRYIDSFQETQNVSFFLVQEYIQGKTLQACINDGKHWNEQELLSLLEQACDVLSYIHSLNPPVIHRDIKPSNLMLTSNNQLKLIDFGGVQTMRPREDGGSTVVGTSGYMPPEQLIGRSLPQSDIYSLGATMVHLMSGTKPTELPVVRMQLQIREVLRGTPEPWLRMLEKMLAGMPEDRFRSAQEVRAAVQMIRNPPPPQYLAPIVPQQMMAPLPPQYANAVPATAAALHAEINKYTDLNYPMPDELVCAWAQQELFAHAQRTGQHPQQLLSVFQQTYLQSKKSHSTAKSLSYASLLLYGCLHRFYLNQYARGLLHFFTCGFFFIGSIYDAVNIDKIVNEENIKIARKIMSNMMFGVPMLHGS